MNLAGNMVYVRKTTVVFFNAEDDETSEKMG
jgi:hypothetical protein